MGAMFSKPKIPKAAEPEVVPAVDEDKIAETRRRSRAQQRARGGRQSTMLSGGEGLLG